MKHPIAVLIVCGFVLVPIVGDCQDQTMGPIEQENIDRMLELRQNINTVFRHVHKKYYAQWRYAEILEVCGYKSLSKLIEPNKIDQDLYSMDEFKKLKDLKYTDDKAIQSALSGVEASVTAYRYGFYESALLYKEYWPVGYCDDIAKSADKFVQERNKQKQSQ